MRSTFFENADPNRERPRKKIGNNVAVNARLRRNTVLYCLEDFLFR